MEDPQEREQLFEQLVARMYEIGKASEAAAFLEIDAVLCKPCTKETLFSPR